MVAEGFVVDPAYSELWERILPGSENLIALILMRKLDGDKDNEEDDRSEENDEDKEDEDGEPHIPAEGHNEA